MATTGFWPLRGKLKQLIEYAANPDKTTNPEYLDSDLYAALRYVENDDKTDKKMFVSGINCAKSQAYEQMTAVKRKFGERGKVVAYHGYQSFAEGEVTPAEAHAIGIELARRMWGDRFQVVVTTHLNTDNVHNHFIINSVSFRDGLKYRNSKGQHIDIRRISDELCRAHGLSVIDHHKPRGERNGEYQARKYGFMTRKEKLALDMKECINLATDVPDFYKLMRERGYVVSLRSKYPSFLPPGAQRPLRLKKDGKSMTEDDIEEMLWDSFERQTEVLVIPRAEKPPVPYYKGMGLSALVLSWMCVLGWIGKGKKVVYRVNREEVRKLKRYIRQHDLLEKYGIDYEDQLDAHAAKRAEEYSELEARREALRKEQRRSGEKDPEIAELTKQMRFVRRELRICEDIKADIPKMRAAFEDVPLLDGKPMYYEEER